MAAKTANPIRSIKSPDVFRGLDSLIDRVSKIVTKCKPKAAPRPVAKSA